MTEMQIMDDSPENYSGGGNNSSYNNNNNNTNLKSSNYYYKSKNSSSVKLSNIKEAESNNTMVEPTGVARLLKDPKLVS